MLHAAPERKDPRALWEPPAHPLAGARAPQAGHIYTRSGRLLLAVNPYRKLPIYSDKILQQYKASLQPQAELPPHVYAVAASAHLGMMQNSMSQSVIISGESGAGKTCAAPRCAVSVGKQWKSMCQYIGLGQVVLEWIIIAKRTYPNVPGAGGCC